MSTNIGTAAREYANRPADERYASPAALVAAAQQQKDSSRERTYNVKDLHAVAEGTEVKLESPKGTAKFTHWAFSQFARFVGAPAAYLRELPATLAADCLNFGLTETAAGSDAVLLVQAPNGQPEPIVRSVTSETYGRVWDADLYGQVVRQIIDQDDRWTTPPTWSGEPAGAYRGDRDSFVILTNGGSIVSDPSLAAGSSDGSMYRGLLISNSEVGARSVQIEQILYRYICGNHMLWGAVMDRSFRRRHVGDKVSRDVVREIATIAFNVTNQSASRDEQIIRALIDREIAHTKAGVLDELKAIGFGAAEAVAAYDRCESAESVSPRSFWGIAQGATRVSQDSQYQGDRFMLDMLAAKVLARGRKLVTV